MWRDNGTVGLEFLEALAYSTDVYEAATIGHIDQKEEGVPLFIYLAWQAVHGPWTLPQGAHDRLLQPDDHGYDNYCSRNPLPLPDPNPQGRARTQTMRCQFGSMLKVLDNAMANITAALQAKGLWESTLMFIMSDNGGIGPGNNFPLRGQKNTPWQGGTRVAAYATGGFVPTGVRGSHFKTTVHFADIYPTLSNLVGIDPADDAVIHGKPRPVENPP